MVELIYIFSSGYYYDTCEKNEEDKDLSIVSNVELTKLFLGKKVRNTLNSDLDGTLVMCIYILYVGIVLIQISKVIEMNLSANQERSEMEKKRLEWKVEGHPTENAAVRGGPVDPVKLVVELVPMEIRTFLIDLAYMGMSRSS